MTRHYDMDFFMRICIFMTSNFSSSVLANFNLKHQTALLFRTHKWTKSCCLTMFGTNLVDLTILLSVGDFMEGEKILFTCIKVHLFASRMLSSHPLQVPSTRLKIRFFLNYRTLIFSQSFGVAVKPFYSSVVT